MPGVGIGQVPAVPSGTTERGKRMNHSFVPAGTGIFGSALPSAEALGYFQKTRSRPFANFIAWANRQWDFIYQPGVADPSRTGGFHRQG